jgi:hypothetical protein
MKSCATTFGPITWDEREAPMLALAATVRMTSPHPKELEKLADKTQEWPPK